MFRATPQWFISMDSKGLLDESLNAVDGIRWEPDWGQARMQSMLERVDQTGVFLDKDLGAFL